VILFAISSILSLVKFPKVFVVSDLLKGFGGSLGFTSSFGERGDFLGKVVFNQSFNLVLFKSRIVLLVFPFFFSEEVKFSISFIFKSFLSKSLFISFKCLDKSFCISKKLFILFQILLGNNQVKNHLIVHIEAISTHFATHLANLSSNHLSFILFSSFCTHSFIF